MSQSNSPEGPPPSTPKRSPQPKAVKKESPNTPRTKWMQKAIQNEVPGDKLKIGKYYYIIEPFPRRVYKQSNNKEAKPFFIFASGKCEEININKRSTRQNDNPYYAQFTHVQVLKSRTESFRLLTRFTPKEGKTPTVNARGPEGDVKFNDFQYNQKSIDKCFPTCSFYFPQNRGANTIFVEFSKAKQKKLEKDEAVYEKAIRETYKKGQNVLNKILNNQILTESEKNQSADRINEFQSDAWYTNVVKGGPHVQSMKAKSATSKGKKTKSATRKGGRTTRKKYSWMGFL